VAEIARNPAVAFIDSAIPGQGDKPLTEVTGWSYTRHRFNETYSSGWTGSGGVRVAVIGDGVECDLAEILCGTGFNVVGHGWDPDVDGGTSHETEAASIIAAVVGNGIGIRGAAPAVTIYSVLAFLPDSGITCPNSADAIDVAADGLGPIRAHVINYSYGGYYPCPSRDSVIYGNYQVLVVAPAGNDGIGTLMDPATNPYTVAVTATTSGDVLWYDSPYGSASNYGSGVTLAAGGKDVKALLYTGFVTTVSGTSVAAPHVTAAIALIIGRKLATEGCVPDRDDVVLALTSSAVPPEPPFVTNWYGAGILHAAAAVDSAIAQDRIICVEW
jgi:subtilisin family serine protease